MLLDAMLVGAIEHAHTEEKHAPCLANAALHHIHHLEPVADFERGKTQRCQANAHHDAIATQAAPLAIEHIVERQKQDARNE